MVRCATGVAILCLVAFSGCMDMTTPRLRALAVASDAPHEGGHGPEDWSVAVVDINGTPIASAPVVGYWPIDRDGDDSFDVVEYVELRSDAEGEVLIHTPRDTPLSVTSRMPGHSEEWLLALAAGEPVQLVLYPETIHAVIEATWDGIANGFTLPRCQMHAFDLGGIVGEAGWIRHVASADLVLQWENGLQGVGDFHLQAMPEELFGGDCPDNVDPDPSLLTPGVHTSTLHLSRSEMADAGWFGTGYPTTLPIGPVAGTAGLGVGLSYSITIDAVIEHSATDGTPEYSNLTLVRLPTENHEEQRDSPAAPLAFFVGLMAVAAVVRRRLA